MIKLILIFLKGIAMGAADVVPGVSGGTIAFITGIYDDLLNSIKSFNSKALLLIRSFAWKELATHLNLKFIIPLVIGIGTSIISLAHLIKHWLESYPILIWSFFMGLIIVSIVYILRQVEKWEIMGIIFGIIGILIGLWLNTMVPSDTAQVMVPWWSIMFSGMLAICAMILPGISGSYILLIIGKYTFILQAVKTLDLKTIGIFGSGCVIGLLLFSRIFSWFLNKYPNKSILLLAGFMVGSLPKLWPWKTISIESITYLTPEAFQVQTGTANHLFGAIFAFCAGIIVVLGLEWAGNLLKKNLA